ncbi:MAG TPA: hypothetical protein VLD66_04730, partial [Methyloceanibacter sp.]|nr:hypothetical protein [Methyloceanibacter sp.]
MARAEGAVGALAPGQRWSLARKRDVVLRLMQGEPVEGLSRRLGLPVYKAGGVAATRARRDRCRTARARRRSAGAGARQGASPHRRV